MLGLLLAVSLCVVYGAGAAELKTNQSYDDVCDWHCEIEDHATVVKTFSRLIGEEEKRFVNLITDAHTDSHSCLCKNSTEHNSTAFDPSWAVDEREPHLYLPDDLTGLSLSSSPLQFKERMTIDLNCNGEVGKTVPGDRNQMPPLESEVARILMHDLVREEGVLCFPRESPDTDRLYECCHFDRPTSAVTCKAVRSTIARWVQALRTFWQCVLYIIAPYLPGVLCFFPHLPKVSEDGTPCIEFEDPSPAALRSLIVKALVPRATDSCCHKFVACILKLLLITAFIAVAVYITFGLYYLVVGASLWCFSLVHVILEIFSPPSAQRIECTLCSNKHLDGLEAVKSHVLEQLSMSTKSCRKFSKKYIKKTESFIICCPGVESAETAPWPVRHVFSALLLPVFLVGCTFVILLVFVVYCPLVIMFVFEVGRLCRDLRNYCSSRSPSEPRPHSWSVRPYFSALFHISLHVWIIYSSITCVILLSYLIMATIDFADTVFPIIASSVLILYYLHKFFSAFSEKYQLVKIKLFQGIQEHHDNGGKSLFVKSKTGAMAIPEELYVRACTELEIPMLKTFWLAIMKMVCLMVFVLSVSGAIMIFGARSGIAPLTKVVGIFLAGLLPQMLSLFSTGAHKETLQEYGMEMKLKDIINHEGETNTERELSSLVADTESVSSVSHTARRRTEPEV